MRKWIPLLFLLLAACAAENTPQPTGASLEGYDGISASHLPAHEGSFVIQFGSAAPWSYRLDTRSNGGVVEYMLHIEGLEDALNPGDVRAVEKDGVIQMHVAGAEEECLQFPTSLDLGPTFLNPDDLLAPDLITAHLRYQGSEKIAGMSSWRFGLRQPALGSWKNALVDIWWADSAQAVVRYDLRVEGPDPLFDTGDGVLSARYQVLAFGPQEIQPISGCEIDYPIPASAVDLVKLPGMVAFESPDSVQELAAFYQSALAGQGWTPEDLPQSGDGVTLLSYRQGDKTLDIKIEELPTGAGVEILSDR